MRVRVQSSWRTRFLILVAVVAAGLIAYFQMQAREARRAQEREAERQRVYEVDVELE